nr:hypothetical protein [Tanacetum cinerariifolium]
KIDEENRLARDKNQKEQEANDALIKTWDDIQAKIDADAQLAQRLHEEEQLQLTDAWTDFASAGKVVSLGLN